MLTLAEKAAAREFGAASQAALDELNAASPPDCYPHVLVHHIRHECAGGRNVSFDMKERYTESPDGRFAFIYREGRCATCHRTGRSRTGRLVDAQVREPAGRS